MHQSPEELSEDQRGTLAIIKAFPRSYWMLNSVEMMERLAYFSMRAMVPLYIMQADDPDGLHLAKCSQAPKRTNTWA